MRLLEAFLIAIVVYNDHAAASPDVPQVGVGVKWYPGWTDADIPTQPKPERIMRQIPLGSAVESGGLANASYINVLLYDDYVCTKTGSPQVYNTSATAPIRAGDTVMIPWHGWADRFGTLPQGPILNYMAKCPKSGCGGWKAAYPETPWFKISHDGYTVTDKVWATNKIFRNHTPENPTAVATVQIPSNIVPGDYILRHEMIDLWHQAWYPTLGYIGHPDFFPVCIQLTVFGNGTLEAGGSSIPGIHHNNDPGIQFDPRVDFDLKGPYVIPGPPIYPGLRFD
ncbi:glycosyl hydrolase family 61-domain-containing protein [Ephemerocybe angulata]|uniref:lytic cellulose monooxygenase (C4-dehydrogenating) n=1 Tax=Ephemerocybe angulata TaxID=980116 RepID=A0A8H6I1M6_9AGAR|nr:glycosyl hydrolase family 61-domain-containing protein [Tulosesus angulatus]